MQYDLVFEGGGAKGMVFAGAMQEFEDQGHTCGRLLGTSAGAIVAALLAAGYSSREMLAALNEREGGLPVFARFMATPPEFDDNAIRHSTTLALLQSLDSPLLLDGVEKELDYWLAKTMMQHARHLFSLIERGGWFSAHTFLAWLQRKLDEGTFQGQPRHFSDMTLSQFFAATGRELSMVGSDTVGGRMLVFNHKTAPDLPVVWAVRMSMSIPMIWPEVAWQAGWGAYLGHDLSGHLIVDGGLLSNFPIELFVSNTPPVIELMGRHQSDNLLGFLIDESLPVPGAPVRPTPAETGPDLGQLPLVREIIRLIDTTTGAHDKMVIDAFERFVVRLPAQGYGTVEFDMSDERREALVAAGRQAMKHYFAEQVTTRAVSALAVGEPSAPTFDPVGYADKIAAKILQ